MATTQRGVDPPVSAAASDPRPVHLPRLPSHVLFPQMAIMAELTDVQVRAGLFPVIPGPRGNAV